jgi:hypothetical protein
MGVTGPFVERDRTAAALLSLLATKPGQDKRHLLAGLRANGFADVGVTDVNSVLYARRGSFVSDGGTPPLWRLRLPGSSAGARHPRTGPPVSWGFSGSYRGKPPRAWQEEALDTWQAI